MEFATRYQDRIHNRLATLGGTTRISCTAIAAEADAEIDRLRALLFERGAMADAPCFCCGYNGPGYFQPAQHPCAARHHEGYGSEA